VDNKFLVALSAIATHQSYTTVATEQAVHLLLNYVATYPLDSIIYQSSDMILCAHANAGFLNKTNSRSRTGAHIYFSENDPVPRFNSAVLSIAQIIKFVMASAAEAELAALFVTAQEMILHRQTLINMRWPQPKSPIQMDNSTAAGVANKAIVPRRAKMMDMRLWLLRCRGSQEQFCYYWDAGSNNWADYHTKHQPDTYHEHTESCMQASGMHPAHRPVAILAQPLAHGFPSPEGFPFLFFIFPNFAAEHYFPYICNVAARVCRSPVSWGQTDRPITGSRTRRHH
jgi:hypothetical protein